MAVSLKHTKVSAKLDGPDATQIQPSDWNDEHTLTLGTGNLLGRTSSGTGAAEEIAFSSIPVTATGGSSSRTLAAHLADVASVKNHGAVGDGSTNDTTAFTAAIAAAARVFVPPGTYRISNITLSDDKTLELAPGAILQRVASGTGAMVTMGNRTAIIGGKIDANEAGTTGNHATISSASKSHVTLDGVWLTNAVGSGYAVDINGGDYIRIERCRIDECDYGVRLHNARYSAVEGCTFLNVVYRSIYGTGSVVRYGKEISIRNNRFRVSAGVEFPATVLSVWPGAIADGTGLTWKSSAPTTGPAYDHNQPFYVGVDVCGNEFSNCPTYGIITQVEFGTISDNIINTCSYSGITPQGRHLTITGNVVADCASVGIDLGNCAWVVCTGNIVRDCDDIGIEVTCVNFGVISGNVISECGDGTTAPMTIGNGTAYGLYSPAQNTIVANNTIVCRNSNINGLNITSAINTLSGYIVDGNNIVTPASPDPSYVAINDFSSLNKSNLIVTRTVINDRVLIGGHVASRAPLTANPATRNENGLRIDGGANAATEVAIVAEGTSTNLDMWLAPKGTGVLRFGSHTGTADTAVSGYIVVKDSGGTVRKLAVIT